jgi:hypothetical protein
MYVNIRRMLPAQEMPPSADKELTYLKCISVSSSYQPIISKSTTNTKTLQSPYLMLPQRLSLQIDHAFFRPAILSKPLRNTTTVRFRRIFPRRRRRQIRVCDLFGHFLVVLLGKLPRKGFLCRCVSVQVRITIGSKPIVSGAGYLSRRRVAVRGMRGCITRRDKIVVRCSQDTLLFPAMCM